MTARKTRGGRTLASEGLGPGGQATAARGGMMMVAGASDADDELIIDEEDDTTMNGPIYPEGKTIRIKLGSLKTLLRQGARR